jgi:mannose-6-phosphate isomerase-like protein (cupin superfamily)
MLRFLRQPDPVRTKTSHLTTIELENGRSAVYFRSSPTLQSPQTSISFRIPPAPPGDNPPDNSIMIPPFHIHPNQSELFLITEGTALFHMHGKKTPVAAGGEFTIPRGAYHKWNNASSAESMTLEAWYDPPEYAREERLFRNLCGYLGDVARTKTGMLGSASLSQMALFAWEADMPICEPSE